MEKSLATVATAIEKIKIADVIKDEPKFCSCHNDRTLRRQA